MGSLLTLAVEGPKVIAPASGWFLENAWIIALLPAISFVLILFFGKRMPKKGSEIGIAAVGIAFILAVLTAGQWINQVDTADERVPKEDKGEEAFGADVELAAGEEFVLPAVEEGEKVSVGVDVVSDGEMSKLSYATYIKDRITGFEGDSDRRAPADLEEYPGFLERQAQTGGTPTYRRPQCVGPIEVKDMGPCNEDIANFRAALDARYGS